MVGINAISFKSSASPAYIQLGYFKKNKPQTPVPYNPLKMPETKTNNTRFGISLIKLIEHLQNTH